MSIKVHHHYRIQFSVKQYRVSVLFPLAREMVWSFCFQYRSTNKFSEHKKILLMEVIHLVAIAEELRRRELAHPTPLYYLKDRFSRLPRGVVSLASTHCRST